MDFIEYKESVSGVCKGAKEFVEKDYPEAAAAIQTAVDYLNTRKVCLAVCGEQNVGKSSLLGMLLEDPDLFPVDINVATCIATTVEYSSTEKITVVTEVGDKKEEHQITRDEIKEYVTEQKNPGNTKNAHLIKIETPNKFLKKNGIVVCDLPGIGSLNPLHSLITKKFIQLSDVVLFVVESGTPLNLYEQEYLKSVYESCPNIICVVSKSDTCDSAECTTIVESTKGKVMQTLELSEDVAPLVIPVSSRFKGRALLEKDPEIKERNLRKSNIEDLENAIWDVVDQNRAGLIVMPAIDIVHNELEKIKSTLSIRELGYSEGKELDIEEVDIELKEAWKRQEELDKDSVHWKPELKKRLRSLSPDINDIIDTAQKDLVIKIDTALNNTETVHQPTTLYNEIESATYSNQEDIITTLVDKIFTVKNAFEKEKGLVIDVDEERKRRSPPYMSWKYNKSLSLSDRVSEVGGKALSNGVKCTIAAGVLGAIVGGAGGFVVGGPAGALLGAKVGSATGAAIFGSVAGAIATIVTVGKHCLNPQYKAKDPIEGELNAFINRCFWSLKSECKELLGLMTSDIVDELMIQITTEKARIKGLIEDLRKAKSTSSAEKKIKSNEVVAQSSKIEKFMADLDSLKENLGLGSSFGSPETSQELPEQYAFLNDN